jgi:hypothetical protein
LAVPDAAWPIAGSIAAANPIAAKAARRPCTLPQLMTDALVPQGKDQCNSYG